MPVKSLALHSAVGLVVEEITQEPADAGKNPDRMLDRIGRQFVGKNQGCRRRRGEVLFARKKGWNMGCAIGTSHEWRA